MQNVQIRWIVRRDVDAIMEIDASCFGSITTCEMLKLLKERQNIGFVVVDGDDVAGFVIYELCKDRLNILKFGIHEDRRKEGFGRALINHMIEKLSPNRRRMICAVISESETEMHLFLKSCGFLAVGVFRNCFDNGLDGYEFRYCVESVING